MVKFLFVKPDGLVVYIAMPGYEDAYIDGQVYGELTARRVETEVADGIILSTWHWNGSDFAEHEPKCIPHYVWDAIGGCWKEPDDYIELIRADSLKKINELASGKILARYPQYQQANMTALAIELLAGGKAVAENDAWENVSHAWDWIKSVRSASNIFYQAATVSDTVDGIREQENDFKSWILNNG
jgi:hypothetical protein